MIILLIALAVVLAVVMLVMVVKVGDQAAAVRPLTPREEAEFDILITEDAPHVRDYLNTIRQD